MYAQLPAQSQHTSSSEISSLQRNIASEISSLAAGTEKFPPVGGSRPGLGDGNGQEGKAARGFLPSPLRTVRVR